MFKRFQRNSASHRLIEEKLYEYISTEMENGELRNGLWAKALENGEGNEERARGLYIKYRKQSIKDEFTIIEEYFEMVEQSHESTPVIENKLTVKEALKMDYDYYDIKYFAEDSGYSLENSKKFVDEGLYAGKKIGDKWFIHKNELSTEFLEKNNYRMKVLD